MSIWVAFIAICAGVRREGTVLEVVSAEGASSDLSLALNVTVATKNHGTQAMDLRTLKFDGADTVEMAPVGAREPSQAKMSICEFGIQGPDLYNGKNPGPSHLYGHRGPMGWVQTSDGIMPSPALSGEQQGQDLDAMLENGAIDHAEYKKRWDIGEALHIRRKGYWCVKTKDGCPGTMNKAHSESTAAGGISVFRGDAHGYAVMASYWADPCKTKGFFGSSHMCCTDEEHYATTLTGTRAKLEEIKRLMPPVADGRGFTVPVGFNRHIAMNSSSGGLMFDETISGQGYQMPDGVEAMGGPYANYQGGIVEGGASGVQVHLAGVGKEWTGVQADPFADGTTWVQIEYDMGPLPLDKTWLPLDNFRYGDGDKKKTTWEMVLDQKEEAAAATGETGEPPLLKIRVRFDHHTVRRSFKRQKSAPLSHTTFGEFMAQGSG